MSLERSSSTVVISSVEQTENCEIAFPRNKSLHYTTENQGFIGESEMGGEGPSGEGKDPFGVGSYRDESRARRRAYASDSARRNLMLPVHLVPDTSRRLRQYAGLTLVILAYVGGIIGWSWAALSVSPPTPSSDTTNAVVVLKEEMHQIGLRSIGHEPQSFNASDAGAEEGSIVKD